MHNIVFEMPNTLLLVSLSVIFITLSTLGVIWVKRAVPNEMRYRDNPIIGNVSALLGVIYGVLVGLTALYLINNINATSEAVQKEANAVADLYRDMKWLEPTIRHDIKKQIILYVDNVVQVEWPLMKKDRAVDSTGDLIIEKISDILHQYKFSDLSKVTVLRDILEDIRNLYDYRQQRIQTSLSALNSEMWIVILIGTILTVAINYFFEMHLFMHIITISAVAIMAASMIFLLITLDRPFKGDFVVEPTAFQNVLDFINADKDP